MTLRKIGEHLRLPEEKVRLIESLALAKAGRGVRSGGGHVDLKELRATRPFGQN
jgi:hypothetical protein